MELEHCILVLIFSIDGKAMARLLTKMCLESEVLDDGKHLKVEVPPTRADILLSCLVINWLMFNLNHICDEYF